MYSGIAEKFDGDKVEINIYYDLSNDIFDYKSILNHINSSIEYEIERPVLVEKSVDNGKDEVRYTFTANVK